MYSTCYHVHTHQHSSLWLTFLQARHAAEIGADSIALITPSFYKPTSAGRHSFLQKTVFLCFQTEYASYKHFTFPLPSLFRRVEENSGSGGLSGPSNANLLLSSSTGHRRELSVRFNYTDNCMLVEKHVVIRHGNYSHNKGCCFVTSSVSVADMLEGIKELLPSFSGVKFSGVDLMDFGRCVCHSKDTWSLLYGVDEVSTLPFNIILQSRHLKVGVFIKSINKNVFFF